LREAASPPPDVGAGRIAVRPVDANIGLDDLHKLMRNYWFKPFAPSIVVDEIQSLKHTWSACDFATNELHRYATPGQKLDCGADSSCKAHLKTYLACSIKNGYNAFNKWRSEFYTEAGIASLCEGILIYRVVMDSDLISAPSHAYHLNLSINPGRESQAWELKSENGNIIASGEGSPKESVEKVCIIARGKGAKIQ
jgi:hypothetical protein